MTDEQKDDMLDDATHAVAEAFAGLGVTLATPELHRVNDFLTGLLADLLAE